jgi:membrane protein
MFRRGLAWLRPIPAAWDRYQADDGPMMAAAVAYYLGLSLFPLLLLLLAGLGWFMRFTSAGQSAEEQLLRTIADHLSPGLVAEVRQTLTLVQDRSRIQGPIGLIAILTTTLAAFSQFEHAFDRICCVPTPKGESWTQSIWRLVIQRGTAFLMLLATGFFLLVVLASNVAMSALKTAIAEYLSLPEVAWRVAQFGSAFVLNLLLLWNIYRWLPKHRIRWRDSFAGALFAAVLWEAGRHVLARFLIGASYSSAYGIVGSFIAILLWCYYAVTVIFVGAEYVQLLNDNRQSTKSTGVSPG